MFRKTHALLLATALAVMPMVGAMAQAASGAAGAGAAGAGAGGGVPEGQMKTGAAENSKTNRDAQTLITMVMSCPSRWRRVALRTWTSSRINCGATIELTDRIPAGPAARGQAFSQSSTYTASSFVPPAKRG